MSRIYVSNSTMFGIEDRHNNAWVRFEFNPESENPITIDSSGCPELKNIDAIRLWAWLDEIIKLATKVSLATTTTGAE